MWEETVFVCRSLVWSICFPWLEVGSSALFVLFFFFLFLHWSFISCVFVYVCVSSYSFPTVHHPFPAMPRMHSLGAVREAWGTVIKDHLKVQNWIQRDEQVEGRTKTASFTSTCFFIAFFKRTSESSLLLLNKKVFFTLIFWENTHLKKKKKSFGLFLDPLLWQDFHLKTRSVQNMERCNTEPNIKKRKQKKTAEIFFFLYTV